MTTSPTTKATSKFSYMTAGKKCQKCGSGSKCRTSNGGDLIHCYTDNFALKGTIESGYVSRGVDSIGFGMWAPYKGMATPETYMAYKEQKLTLDQRQALELRKQFRNCLQPGEAHAFWSTQSEYLNTANTDDLLGRGLSKETIESWRFGSVGNGDHRGYRCPVVDINGYYRGAQKRLDSKEVDGKYRWMGDEGGKHLIEHYPVLELPSQHVATNHVLEGRAERQRGYKLETITRLIITEGILKPIVAFEKHGDDTTMVIGYSGGNVCRKTLSSDLQKLPNLKQVIIAADAGAGDNQYVLKSILKTCSFVDSIVNGTDIQVGIYDWGQWFDKTKGDVDEVSGLGEIRNHAEMYEQFLERIEASTKEDVIREFKELYSSELEGAEKSCGIPIHELSQNNKDWFGDYWLKTKASGAKMSLLSLGTGHGKSHAVQQLVEKEKQTVLYLCASPNNPSTEFLAEKGIRFPVKHPGLTPNTNGLKLANGRSQLVNFGDDRGSKDKKKIEVKANCTEYYTRVVTAAKMPTAESPCNDCPAKSRCHFANVEKPAYLEKIKALKEAGEGFVVLAHHNSLLGGADTLNTHFDVVVVDDVKVEVSQTEISNKYIASTVIPSMYSAGLRGVATELSNALDSARKTIYSVGVDLAKLVQSIPQSILVELAEKEAEAASSIEYEGSDYEDFNPELDPTIGLWREMPGSAIAVNGKIKKTYTAASKRASIEYCNIRDTALDNQASVRTAAIEKGSIGKFFKLILDNPDCQALVDTETFTIHKKENILIEGIKDVADHIIISDATTIPSEMVGLWGIPQSDMIKFVSTDRDNSNLTLVDMIDLKGINKRSDQQVGIQIAELAIEEQRLGQKVAVIANKQFMELALYSLEKHGIPLLSAFGDSRGSNSAEKVTSLVVASSFRISLSALQVDYKLAYNLQPTHWVETKKNGLQEVATAHFANYRNERNTNELLQAVGRVRHNRRDEPIKVFVPNLKELSYCLASKLPGVKADTIVVANIARTAKQNMMMRIMVTIKHSLESGKLNAVKWQQELSKLCKEFGYKELTVDAAKKRLTILASNYYDEKPGGMPSGYTDERNFPLNPFGHVVRVVKDWADGVVMDIADLLFVPQRVSDLVRYVTNNDEYQAEQLAIPVDGFDKAAEEQASIASVAASLFFAQPEPDEPIEPDEWDELLGELDERDLWLQSRFEPGSN